MRSDWIFFIFLKLIYDQSDIYKVKNNVKLVKNEAKVSNDRNIKCI